MSTCCTCNGVTWTCCQTGPVKPASQPCFTPPKKLIHQPLELGVQRHLLLPCLRQHALALLQESVVGGCVGDWPLVLALAGTSLFSLLKQNRATRPRGRDPGTTLAGSMPRRQHGSVHSSAGAR